MKRWVLLLWLLVPLPVVVWHYGAGQKWLALDHAHSFITRAEQAEAAGNWALAEELYRGAADKIANNDPPLRLQLDVAIIRTRYNQGGAVDSIDGITRVLADARFHALTGAAQREARELAGRIHYHAAWVMRLEGAQRDLWMEQAESALQNYRLLTESSLEAGQSSYATTQHTNLEVSVRLQRMSLIELMSRPLPEEGRKMVGQGLSEEMAKRRGQRGQDGPPSVGESGEGSPASGAGTTRFPGGTGS